MDRIRVDRSVRLLTNAALEKLDEDAAGAPTLPSASRTFHIFARGLGCGSVRSTRKFERRANSAVGRPPVNIGAALRRSVPLMRRCARPASLCGCFLI